jgi:hypothetical protein
MFMKYDEKPSTAKLRGKKPAPKSLQEKQYKAWINDLRLDFCFAKANFNSDSLK